MSVNRLTENTHETSLGELLDDRSYFRIPPFQRQYKWTSRQIKQLNEDIIELLDVEEHEDKAHFLGAVILDQLAQDPSSPKVYEVVDGQQRLTTFFLLIAAGVDVLIRHKHQDEASALALNYLFTREGPTTLSSSLQPSIPDVGDLNSLLEGLWGRGLGAALPTYSYKKAVAPEDWKRGRITKNFKALRKLLELRFESQGASGLTAYLTAAQTRLTVVQILVKDPTTGPSIFDSLNSQQEPMTTGELVRNEIFGKLARIDPEGAQDLDQTMWQPFFRSFSRDGKSSFDNFFFPFGLIQDSGVKKSDVYRTLRKQWSDLGPEDVIEELKQYSTEFQDLQFGENKCGLPAEVAAAVQRFHRLNFPSVALPFLMQVLHHVRTGALSGGQGLELLSAIEAFLVRRALVGIEPTGLHAVFKKLWSQLDGDFSNSKVRRIIGKAVTVQVPTDSEVIASFEKPLYPKSISRFFVFEYDASRGGDIGTFSGMWVEHILPQSFSLENWPELSSKVHDQLRHLAGNLIPLSPEMNGGLGTNPYADKRPKFGEDSMFKSAREVAADYEEWTESTILERTQMLAEWAVRRWSF